MTRKMLLAVGIAAVATVTSYSPSSPPRPIQRLEIARGPDGPVVLSLFGRSAVPNLAPVCDTHADCGWNQTNEGSCTAYRKSKPLVSCDATGCVNYTCINTTESKCCQLCKYDAGDPCAGCKASFNCQL
jgi:hypothetical protein